MKKLILFLMATTVLILSGCATNQQYPPINVMVLVQDDSGNAVSHSSSAMKRLVNNVSSDLNDNGINVYDWPSQFNARGVRSEAMLVDMARSFSRATIDYLVILSADASVSSSDYTTRIKANVYGKTLAVHSGRFKGAYTSEGRVINAKGACNDYCVNSSIGDSLAAATGDVSAEILNSLDNVSSRGTNNRSNRNSRIDNAPIGQSPNMVEYTMTFDGFTQSNINEIEEYLSIFSGYERLRYITNRHQFAELVYESAISRNKLNKNLNRMLSEMGIVGAVSITGNTVTVRKTSDQSSTKFDLDGWEE